MATQLTSINEFSVGDHFIHYGATFKVTGECNTYNEGVTYYGRTCEIVHNPKPNSNISGLLDNYDWMQGTKDVRYAKIIN